MNPTRPLLLVAVMLLPACEARNLYVAHDTVVGLNAKLSNGRQQGQLLFGYDRDFATVIPKSVELKGTPQDKDVMSLVHCSDLTVDGIFISEYRDVTVTGDAAIRLAKAKGIPTLLEDCSLGEKNDNQ